MAHSRAVSVLAYPRKAGSMNNEPRRGDGDTGLAIAPSGLRNKRASHRGFAGAHRPAMRHRPLRGRIHCSRDICINDRNDGFELSDTFGCPAWPEATQGCTGYRLPGSPISGTDTKIGLVLPSRQRPHNPYFGICPRNPQASSRAAYMLGSCCLSSALTNG